MLVVLRPLNTSCWDAHSIWKHLSIWVLLPWRPSVAYLATTIRRSNFLRFMANMTSMLKSVSLRISLLWSAPVQAFSNKLLESSTTKSTTRLDRSYGHIWRTPWIQQSQYMVFLRPRWWRTLWMEWNCESLISTGWNSHVLGKDHFTAVGLLLLAMLFSYGFRPGMISEQHSVFLVTVKKHFKLTTLPTR